MPTLGFLIDNRKCIGCHACTVACKSEHEVPLGVDRTWVKYIEKGAFPHSRRLFTVMRCNHCDRAPCVTICPVTSLYRRPDGVVDFHPDRCIGCKACLQACPYDALHIHPETHTAAKCNFCTHRLEQGLEPSCVVVCPEQAIVCGDLDDPQTRISQLVERHPVQVRKPEKGTRPKLYYIEADEAALMPNRAPPGVHTLWSRYDEPMDETVPAEAHVPSATPGATAASSHGTEPRRTYDVRPRGVTWGWPVAAYTWTKSIATGSVLAVATTAVMANPFQAARLAPAMSVSTLIFLLITTALLIGDLKQPQRFLYVLLRPQWKSWLVKGAYFLTVFGLLATLWAAAVWTSQERLANGLLWPTALLAIPTAVYTAFLFAQAKGRDLWQSPLLAVHFLVHALLAGGALWLVMAGIHQRISPHPPRQFTLVLLGISLASLAAELLTVHATSDARHALKMITGRRYGLWFWGVAVGVGHVLPLVILTTMPLAAPLAAVLILAGLLALESLWVVAPQHIPLS